MKLPVRYALFALLAMSANIGAQMISFAVYSGKFALWLAMAVGTVVGVLLKYALDKRWIFDQGPYSLSQHGQTFSLYSLMAVPTTLLFWLTEWAFDTLGGGPPWRYVGAVIGLSAGYWLKYQLDRRYVFRVAGA